MFSIKKSINLGFQSYIKTRLVISFVVSAIMIFNPFFMSMAEARGNIKNGFNFMKGAGGDFYKLLDPTSSSAGEGYGFKIINSTTGSEEYWRELGTSLAADIFFESKGIILDKTVKAFLRLLVKDSNIQTLLKNYNTQIVDKFLKSDKIKNLPIDEYAVKRLYKNYGSDLTDIVNAKKVETYRQFKQLINNDPKLRLRMEAIKRGLGVRFSRIQAMNLSSIASAAVGSVTLLIFDFAAISTSALNLYNLLNEINPNAKVVAAKSLTLVAATISMVSTFLTMANVVPIAGQVIALIAAVISIISTILQEVGLRESETSAILRDIRSSLAIQFKELYNVAVPILDSGYDAVFKINNMFLQNDLRNLSGQITGITYSTGMEFTASNAVGGITYPNSLLEAPNSTKVTTPSVSDNLGLIRLINGAVSDYNSNKSTTDLSMYGFCIEEKKEDCEENKEIFYDRTINLGYDPLRETNKIELFNTFSNSRTLYSAGKDLLKAYKSGTATFNNLAYIVDGKDLLSNRHNVSADDKSNVAPIIVRTTESGNDKVMVENFTRKTANLPVGYSNTLEISTYGGNDIVVIGPAVDTQNYLYDGGDGWDTISFQYYLSSENNRISNINVGSSSGKIRNFEIL